MANAHIQTKELSGDATAQHLINSMTIIFGLWAETRCNVSNRVLSPNKCSWTFHRRSCPCECSDNIYVWFLVLTESNLKQSLKFELLGYTSISCISFFKDLKFKLHIQNNRNFIGMKRLLYYTFVKHTCFVSLYGLISRDHPLGILWTFFVSCNSYFEMAVQ